MSVKLKLLRVQAGLTLEALAQAAELTRSYVSKLERGVSTPSISAGLKIAKALGVTVEELFADTPDDDPVVISRAAKGEARTADGTPRPPRVVSGAQPSHRMVAFVIAPSDEPVRNHPMSHHKGEELLYVLKGSIALRLARRTETLHAGDSAHFNSSIPHKITSVGKVPASVLLVIAQDE
ncbi:XRE family transcriptional regulator [Achromobacter aloeverae]|nr:XRE family transcriptional regulator [Achromobacter aloeverae]